ncbi:hypothetical protein NDN08_006298 [Rhodosorus marinus]|uniref:Methionine synthase reductase n=1 Tax=Rhodosorus marinus TaxID=101924 RepID=A0AAV8UQW8_9RHOD|nr:hypothetical protein NDN08_006298 [Rhodosorus marinus]
MGNERLVDVMYGSETGNAEAIARRIHAELGEHGLSAGCILPLNSYEQTCLSHVDEKSPVQSRMFVFVISTYGDGDVPFNTDRFFKYLRKKSHPVDFLRNVSYAVLGLGDTNYTNFCNGSKRLERALKKYGAKNVYYRGEADDEIGLHLVVEPWIDGLWDAMNKYFGAEAIAPALQAQTEKLDPSPAKAPTQLNGVPKPAELKLRVEESVGPVENSSTKTENGEFTGRVCGARLLTSTSCDKRVWHMEVESDNNLSYQPGDAFSVRVRNNAEEVDELLAILKVDGNKVISIYDGENLVNGPEKVKDTLGWRYDIRSPASKKLLRALADSSTDAADEQRLLLWSSRTGRKEYEANILNKSASLLDVLLGNPSCVPSINILLELLPALQPRFYSAASAVEYTPRAVHFAFSVVEAEVASSVRRGVATGYLEDLCRKFIDGERTPNLVLSSRSSGKFKPPAELDVPYIMIGPGTGVAPFLGFLQQRSVLRVDSENLAADVSLYFGCRRRDTDHLYEEELDRFVEGGTLSYLSVAFSREHEHKVYVQDKIKAEGQQLCKLLVENEKSRVYICGDGGEMVRGVVEGLTSVLQDHGGMSKADAKLKMTALERSDRLIKDVWYWG